MTCAKHGGNDTGSIICRFCDLETIEREAPPERTAMNLVKRLLPCPFCGNEAEVRPYSNHGCQVQCKQCGARISGKALRQTIDWLRGNLIAAWNKRASDALESAGELPEEPAHIGILRGFGNLSTQERLSIEYIDTLRTAYSALAARFERMQKERDGWEADTSSVARLLQQAESRIAELEQKVSVIYDGNAVYAEMSVHAHARTSPENVSDTLDSVNRIWKQLSTDKGEG